MTDTDIDHDCTDEPDVGEMIFVWSMRPKPDTPNGAAWEQGARQGWAWRQKTIDALKACVLRMADEARELAEIKNGSECCDYGNYLRSRAESLEKANAALVAENESLRKAIGDAEAYQVQVNR